jgi:hypothetical protein
MESRGNHDGIWEWYYSASFTSRLFHILSIIWRCGLNILTGCRWRILFSLRIRIGTWRTHFHANTVSDFSFLDRLTPLVSRVKTASLSNAFRQTQSSLERSKQANRMAAVLSSWIYVQVWKFLWWWSDRWPWMHVICFSPASGRKIWAKFRMKRFTRETNYSAVHSIRRFDIEKVWKLETEQKWSEIYSHRELIVRLSSGWEGPATFGSERNNIDWGNNEPQLRTYRLLQG